MFVIISVSMFSSVLLILLAFLMFYLGESITFIVLIVYSGVQVSMSMSFISSFSVVIYARMILFNDCIKQSFKHILNKEEAAPFNQQELTAIAALMDIHAAIINEVDNINGHLGLQCALGIGFTWMNSLFGSFTFLAIAFDRSFDINNSVIFNSLWCLYLNLYIISIMYGSTILHVENLKTMKLLTSIVKQTNNQFQLAKLLALCTQIQKRPATISSGLFDVNWKFGFTVNNFVSLNRLIISHAFSVHHFTVI